MASELVGRRARDAKHFIVAGAQRQAVFSPHQHYQDDNGDWRDVELDFEPQGGGVHLVTKHLLNYRADATGLAVWHRPTGRGIKFVFPRAPDRVQGRSAEWDTADGTTWRLAARKTGLKTTALVVARRGPRTYRFDAEMLGGVAPPQEHVSGALVHQHFVIPRATVHGADGVEYACSAWRLQAGEARFDFDDGVLPEAALPYVIDPTTTFNVAASGDDGYVYGDGPAYPPSADLANATATTVLVRKGESAGTYFLIVGLIRWDTSSLPDDATVTAATLRVRVTSFGNEDGRQLTAEWYEADTITVGDYSTTVGTDAHAGTSLASITNGADNDFVLSNLANVNKAGYTGLRLHISGDEPAGNNVVAFAAFDHATLTEPRLIVEYTEAGGEPSASILFPSRVVG